MVRQHRSKAEDLFAEELDRTLKMIAAAPSLGKVYEQLDLDIEVRRLLMAKTCNHIDYAVTATEITSSTR